MAPQVGELHVRGYSVMLGYWGDAAATAAAIDQVSGASAEATPCVAQGAACGWPLR